MKLRGQTPLAQAGIGDELRRLLKSLWIETVEEAVAVGSAVDGDPSILENAGFKALISSKAIEAVSPTRLSEIQVARQGGGLGCLVDDQVLKDFRRMGRLRPTHATPSGAFEAKLPSATRFMDRMPPVRDQGQRGTCVAFGAVALREFLLGSRDDLSEQFLYWACKELDGHPGPGTYIHTAMSALAQYGVCQEAIWPYNPSQMDDEGQGPPPPGANDDARSCRLDSTRTVEPNLVVHYKHVLAGDHAGGGMPVTFGSLVFNSWYMSPETHRTGKITLPLPGETPVGGHAWCIVGYVDDDDVPGGGYFIVRNSWGAKWAADGPEAAGHALMPYEYVERFTFEAFTGPSAATMVKAPVEADPEWRDFIRILAKDERDTENKLLKRGTQVLCHPSEPGAIREDSPANRQEFLRLDRAWTPELRQQIWFPRISSIPSDLSDMAEDCRSAKTAFLAAIDENIMSARGQPIPEVNSLPFWFAVLAWEPKIKDVAEVADLTARFTDCLASKSNVPEQVSWPDDWRQWLASMNGLKVYALSGMTTTVHVVAAPTTGIRFQAPGRPAIEPPGQEIVELVRETYRQWTRESGQQAAFTFFTLASAAPWPDQVSGYAAGDHWLLLSSRDADGSWRTSAPPRFADRLTLRNFMDRLRPETRQHRISKIKRFVDELLDSGYEGNIHLEKIAKKTGYRRTVVRDTVFALQNSGHYRVYRTPEGQIAVGRKGSRVGITVTAATFHGSWLARLACLGPAVSAGVWFVKDLILGRPFEFWGFAVMIPLAYGGEWLNTRFRKWREDKE